MGIRHLNKKRGRVFNLGSCQSIAYDSDNATLIGAEASDGSWSSGCHFKGKLDQVRIWVGTRSGTDIREMMRMTWPAAYTRFHPYLRCYYRFNDGEDIFVSEIINGVYGTLQNMSDVNWEMPGAPVGLLSDPPDDNDNDHHHDDSGCFISTVTGN
jgi:hypothetical protein